MKPSDLTGEHRRLYESFRASGMSEQAALTATAGRDGALRPVSSFDALAEAFTGLGLSADGAQVAAVGRVSEHEARALHAAADQRSEDAAVVSTVRDLAARYCLADRALSEQQATARACTRVREAFAGSEHANRVGALLRKKFPPPPPTPRPGAGRRVSSSVEARLREARRRGTGLRVLDDRTGKPTGEILTLTEIDRLLGGTA